MVDYVKLIRENKILVQITFLNTNVAVYGYRVYIASQVSLEESNGFRFNGGLRSVLEEQPRPTDPAFNTLKYGDHAKYWYYFQFVKLPHDCGMTLIHGFAPHTFFPKTASGLIMATILEEVFDIIANMNRTSVLVASDVCRYIGYPRQSGDRLSGLSQVGLREWDISKSYKNENTDNYIALFSRRGSSTIKERYNTEMDPPKPTSPSPNPFLLTRKKV